MVLLRTKKQLCLGGRGFGTDEDIYIELSDTGAEVNVSDKIQFSLTAEDIATLKHFLVNFTSDEG